MTPESPSPTQAGEGRGEGPTAADPQPVSPPAGPPPAAEPEAPPPAAEPEAPPPAAEPEAPPPAAEPEAPPPAAEPEAPPPAGEPEPSPPAGEPDEDSLRLAEAMVFASASPVTARALSQLLPAAIDADAVIAALRARYAGRGVELADAAGGVQFRTAADLAPRLRKIIEVPRRLPRVAMETLAIIAYHQPCTRAEVEEIRGTGLSQQTLDALLEANLVAPKGRREVPGRPTLWGTTPQFLAQFGLKDLRDLPQRGDLILEPPPATGVSNEPPLTSELPAEGEAAASDQAAGAPERPAEEGLAPDPKAGGQEEATDGGSSLPPDG
jgi:segregation and condensation protein B